MPVAVSYPGVYLEELPSGVHTITGVATSIAAFIGRAWSGEADKAITIYSYGDYVRQFGGLWSESSMSYAVQQFFQNGGGQAIIVRAATKEAVAATYTIDNAVFAASSPGSWGSNLVITVDAKTKDPSDKALFNLTVVDDASVKNDSLKRGGSGARETFLNVSVDSASPRYVTTILAQQSQLLRVSKLTPGTPPTAPAAGTSGAPTVKGDDGKTVTDKETTDDANQAGGTGMYALDQADIFNMLIIPPLDPEADNPVQVWTKAAKYCHDHRAILLVDAPASWPTAVQDPATLSTGDYSSNAAVYFPRIVMANDAGNLQAFAPSGAVAGVYARTDVARGVWKAPAGTMASLQGVTGFEINGKELNLTDNQIGAYNKVGVNCLRNLAVFGPVVWGTRTLDGADIKASDWKYVPVRRLALFLEESLFRALTWVVFEPNDEPLWAQIRLNVGAFMQGLFRQGAFQGQSAKDAYFVKCDKETTTQNDINLGIVNIVVGFAPLKPAEFVIVKIQQMAGQIQT